MVFEKTFPLIVIFLLGYLLKKIKILDKNNSKILGKLLVNLVIPAVIIKSFSQITLEPSLIYLPVSALIVVSCLLVLGYIFARILNLQNKTKGAFITVFPTLEGGSIGYAFMFSVFGELGLSRIVLFDFANAIFLFTVVSFVSSQFGNGKVGYKESFLKILKSPLVWAMIIGLLFNIIGFKNVLISNLLDVAGSGILLLIMLMLGLELQPKISYFKLPVVTILLKTTVGLMLGWLISGIFGLQGMEKIAVIIGSSLPPSILTLIFAEENDLDMVFVANLLSIALPVSLLFFSILLNFL